MLVQQWVARIIDFDLILCEGNGMSTQQQNRCLTSRLAWAESMGFAVLLVLVFLLIPMGALKAQNGATTGDRLDAMMRELQEMKRTQARQQAQIEKQNELIVRQQKMLQTRTVPVKTVPVKTVPVLRPVEVPSDAPQNVELKSQKRVDRFEAVASTTSYGAPRPAAKPPVDLDNVVTGGSKPGSFKMPGSSTSFKISGYVKGDAIYSLDHDVGDFFISSFIPVSGTAANAQPKGSFRAHARQTRLKVQSWTPTRYGQFSTRLEGDFVGAGASETFGNSSTFRLRHAYGQLGPLLVGQTWTAFMDLNAYPATVDFFGPTAIPFVRQGQVRLTLPVATGTKLLLSAENSEMAGHADGNAGADGIAANATITSETSGQKFGIDVAPDFVVALKHRNDYGSVSAAGLMRFFETNTPDIPNDSVVGWGVHLSGHVKLRGQDKLAGGFAIGEGVGRYLINGAFSSTDVTVNTETGTLSPDLSWGAYGFYTHYWSPDWSTNLVYGHEEHADAVAGAKTLQTAHANLFFTPVPQAKLGIEYVYGHRKDVSGASGEANRVQFGAWWNF